MGVCLLPWLEVAATGVDVSFLLEAGPDAAAVDAPELEADESLGGGFPAFELFEVETPLPPGVGLPSEPPPLPGGA